MQRTVWKSSSHLVVLFIILVITTACLGTPAQTAVPTLAAVANLPVGGETAVVVANNVVLPGTFTPEPQTTAVQNNLSAAVPRALNSEPSATPYIPTNTPRPTWGPPTRTPLPTPTFTPSPTSVFAAGAAYRGNPVVAAGGYPPVTSGSKLSIHVIRSNRKVMDFVRAARPAVIKSVGDLGFLTEVKKISPDTMTIGRIDQLSQNYDGNPEEAARQFVAKQLEQYRLNPGVDYWEGWNEPNPTMANMGWYARFEQERVRELARHGFRAAIGGFATGTPEVEEFALFVPAVETALQYGGILTLHEYSAPEMTHLYGAALPGYPAYADRGALTFRYRWFYREILEPAGLVIPLVVTEAGIDGIIGNRPGPGGYGWEDFQSYAVDKGWGNDGTEAFINQLAWYDAGVRQDNYVYGFTVFTAGPVGHWKKYDIDRILPDLARYVTGQR